MAGGSALLSKNRKTADVAAGAATDPFGAVELTSEARKSLESRPKSKDLRVFDDWPKELESRQRARPEIARRAASNAMGEGVRTSGKPVTPVDAAAKTLTEETEVPGIRSRIMPPTGVHRGPGPGSSTDAFRGAQ